MKQILEVITVDNLYARHVITSPISCKCLINYPDVYIHAVGFHGMQLAIRNHSYVAANISPYRFNETVNSLDHANTPFLIKPCRQKFQK